jgi:hypothetical protein
VQRGLGTAYAHMTAEEEGDERRDDLIAFAATCFRRAGAHAILTDDLKLSREMFNQAAEQYARLSKPYALMMWALADNRLRMDEYMRKVWPSAEDRQNHIPSGMRRQNVYSLLYFSVTREPDQNQIRNLEYSLRRVITELQAMNPLPTGVLGIPVIHYVALANALRDRNGPHSILEALFPFIATYDIAFRTAQSKRSHWRHLRLPFHPAEPDIFAVLSIVSKALLEFQFSLADALDRLPISFGSRTTMQSFLRSDGDEPDEKRIFNT